MIAASIFGVGLGVPFASFDSFKLASDNTDDKLTRLAKLFFDGLMIAGAVCCIVGLCTAGYIFTPLTLAGVVIYLAGVIPRIVIMGATRQI